MNQDRPSLAMCFLAYPAVAIVYIGLIAAALCLTGCGKDDTSATEQPQTPAELAPVVEEPDEPFTRRVKAAGADCPTQRTDRSDSSVAGGA